MATLLARMRRATKWFAQSVLWLIVLGLVLDHALDTAGAAPVLFRYAGF